MSEKFIKYITYIIKAGVFVLPVMALLVADSLFFPFITSKNFFFRIMVEIMFFLWVFVAVFDKKYRPRKSPVLLALVSLLVVLSLATIFGENPYRSFWSNYERMEGLIGHIHLFGYFLVLGSVFQSKKDWKLLFGSMLGVSTVVTGYGFLQLFGKARIHQSDIRLDASLGNSGYLAIFLIFHLFLISLFFFWFKNKWARIGLAVLFILESIIIFYTATRGAILGLGGGLFLFALLIAIFSKNKKIRLGFLSFIVFLVLVSGLFLVFKDSQFVKGNAVLKRMASISLTETTVESRFTIWGMSWEGFQEHPVLGWGPENYNLVFNKYYKPKLWRQEPWFDRSHNIIFDWLISAGLLGLLAYLSIFVSALFLAWILFKKNKFSLFEFSSVFAVFAAYFFHNIFVFDNLTSYFMFFSVLGYLHSSYQGDRAKEGNGYIEDKEVSPVSYAIVTAAFILTVFSLYFVNFKPVMACKQLLNTLYNLRVSQSPVVVLEGFDSVIKHKTFGTSEAREQLVSYAGQASSLNNVSQEDKVKILNKAVFEMEKQVESSPKDIRYLLMMSSVYGKGGRLSDAIRTIDIAITMSPKKQHLYFIKADFLLALGRNEEALLATKTAYELDESYKDAAKNLAILYALNGKEEEKEELLVKNFSKKNIADKQLLSIYIRQKNYEKVRDVWLEFIEKDPTNVQYRTSLSATYLQLNERQKAIEVLQGAVEINPEFAEQSEYFINEIRAGRNP